MSAVGKIIEWINDSGKPVWWKHSIRIAISKGQLDFTDHELIYKIARKQAGFPEEVDLAEFAQPISADGYGVEEQAVYIRRLGPIKNISALSEDQSLHFAKNGMTVVYGDNGVGKSSYSRILKNICLSRGEKPPLPSNVFKTTSVEQFAKVSYEKLDGSTHEAEWRPTGNEIKDLKSIRVFDSASAAHYVQKEDEIEYRPSGLGLLDELTRVCEVVKGQVDKKITEYEKPQVLPAIDPTTKIAEFIKGLNAHTSKDDLQKYLLDSSQSNHISDLQKEIVELRFQSVDQIRKNITQKILQIRPLKQHFDFCTKAVSAEKIKEIVTHQADLVEKTKIAELIRDGALTNLPIAGIGGKHWQMLWEAARNFISNSPSYPSFPPIESSSCPLCLQDIHERSAKKMVEFEKYIKSDAQRAVDLASKVVAGKVNALKEINLDIKPFGAVLNVLKDEVEGIDKNILTVIEGIEEIRKKVLDVPPGAVLDVSTVNVSLDISIIEKLDALLTNLQINLDSLTDDQGKVDILKAKEALVRELSARKAYTDSYGIFEGEIKRLKTLEAYSKIRQQINLRPITTLTNAISNDYVASALIEHFKEELKFFGFSSFSVEMYMRGTQGSQLFGVKINGAGSNTKFHSIASEGEQKCIALASVLAEMKADKRNSGIIFDDPVNSLDHRWRERVAQRLIVESVQRQVVVFTHDIVFLKFLLEISEATEGAVISVQSLDRSRVATGIVRDNPPWDAMTTSKRVGRLEQMLDEIKKIEISGTEGDCRAAITSFYGYLREAWERLVEEKLLNNVVQRFSRGVSTMRLKRVVDLQEADYEKVEAAMTKCSALFRGHDTAHGVYETMPNASGVEADLNEIRIFEKHLTKDRKRS